MARIVLFSAAVALLSTCCAGCSGAETPSPVPAAIPSATLSAAPADDPPGLITCREVAAALREATLMDAGVVERIVASSRTADAPVADAATELGDAYARALAARDQPGEPDAVAAVSAAAADMSEICGDSGLESIRG